MVDAFDDFDDLQVEDVYDDRDEALMERMGEDQFANAMEEPLMYDDRGGYDEPEFDY